MAVSGKVKSALPYGIEVEGDTPPLKEVLRGNFRLPCANLLKPSGW